MDNCVKVLTASQFKSNANIGDIFIAKDGRVLVFIGYNDVGWFHFLLVDNAIGKENYWITNNTLKDVVWYNIPVILRRFEESLNNIVCNVPYKELIFSYNKLPALVNCIGHSDNSLIAGITNQMGLHQGKTTKKTKSIDLKRGYVYKVQNKSYSELYLYLGYDGNFRINIPKNKLTLVGRGKLNVSDLPDEGKFLAI